MCVVDYGHRYLVALRETKKRGFLSFLLLILGASIVNKVIDRGASAGVLF